MSSMFTGIIEKTGVIKKIERNYFTIEVKDFLTDLKIGDSIAVNGVCLTVIELDGESFKIELMPETLRLTNFSSSKEGDEVNLEKSLKVRDRLDGHFVLGHVDGVGEAREIKKDGEFVDLIISVPADLQKYIAKKGAIAVNGISLTIAEDLKDSFRASLTTHTCEVTNLKNIKEGDLVNLEVDILARYLEKLSE